MSNDWRSETYPSVPPDATFRQELQRALEQTHRQQAAQRKLGTNRRHTRRPRLRWLIAGLLAIVTLILVARRMSKTDPAAAS